MALQEVDRALLERCLARKPRAWEDFVDRFLGLVIHVVNHSAQARSVRLQPQDREDLCADVFLTIVRDDFAVLRHFRGTCSLATYLTVVSRRVVVREILQRKSLARLSNVEAVEPGAAAEARIENREEVDRLLDELTGTEADVVRLYHLEEKTYQEISAATGIPENTVGPMLSRARAKMRRAGEEPTPQESPG
ncbi:MAG: sigma-70 family RNA polymerase sigma factor [Planctomycetes bacterium]|nr:sigma-70 family RNA polymerase sigma factor [Planctomycetota bacterium]